MPAKITYTFPADSSIAQLRGVAVQGGLPCTLPDGTAGVRFETRIQGRTVMARLSTNPTLASAVAEYQAAADAEAAAKAAALNAIGWDRYEPVLRAASNARAAYDRASEYGYPAHEAEEMRRADEALDAARIAYPGAAAYALAESYRDASHYAKSAAGRKAMVSIEAGSDPIAAAEEMRREWIAAAMSRLD